jgi:protein SCO1/2
MSKSEHPILRLVGQPTFWACFVGFIFVANILRAMATEVPSPPPLLGAVPEFALTDQSNEAYGSEQLHGKIWVANFIFTRCATICPVFSAEMSTLQKRTNKAAAGLQLVSFSVDPEYDTPDRLAEYARRFSANPWYWHFLTGPITEVRSMVVEGMKTAMGEAAEVDMPDALFHGSHFVLVDDRMQIRGFYDVNDPETIERLLTDVQLIIASRPSGLGT